MIINEKNGTKKGLSRLVVQIGAKKVNSSALLQCGLVNALLNSFLKQSGNQIFIYNHSSHVPIFLSHSPLTPSKCISKILGKINFSFDFSQILELCFLLLFFHNHFLEPILHHLNNSHDFKFVFWSSGIQNEQPLFTVYPLYFYIYGKLLLNTN
jgi:hypothetical protein